MALHHVHAAAADLCSTPPNPLRRSFETPRLPSIYNPTIPQSLLHSTDHLSISTEVTHRTQQHRKRRQKRSDLKEGTSKIATFFFEGREDMGMAVRRRERDAEAELNLPPGFRFHPTDDELVEHYLCRKAAGQRLPVPIIAEIDLYKFDPWNLPDRALFGTREWYFFTPRDRKYPNGSRPNRAAGNGYWKATGADKPVAPRGRTLGIKKALVFYAGKAPRGVKTDWIMHEYRLADAGRATAGAKKGSLRLDDWVLCRLYNKKNEWEKMQQGEAKEAEEEAAAATASDMVTSHSHSQSHSHSWGEARTPESEIVDNDPFPAFQSPAAQEMMATMMVPKKEADEHARNDLFVDLSYDDIQSMYSGLDMLPPGDGLLDYCSLFASPRVRGSQPGAGGMPAPF